MIDRLIKALLSPPRKLLRTYRHARACHAAIPCFVKSRWRWFFRAFMRPWVRIHCLITHRDGFTIRLAQDRIDDKIFDELFNLYTDLFFPRDLVDIPSQHFILDVGAHHGIFAVAALHRYSKCRLIAIEPDPDGARMLRQNLRLNGFENRAEIHECAVADRNGTALLEMSTDGSWGNHLTQKAADAAVVSVRTCRLEDIVGTRNPYLVKANCEGGEFSLIPQLLDLGMRPEYIILLAHPEHGDVDLLLKRLQENGYETNALYNTLSHPRYLCRLVATSR